MVTTAQSEEEKALALAGGACLQAYLHLGSHIGWRT